MIGAAAVIGLALVAAATGGRPTLSRIAKMAASTGVLIMFAVANPVWSGYAVFVGAALTASWLGDLALSFSGKRPFLAGLAAFAGAHVLYTAAFFARSPTVTAVALGALVVMIVVGSLVVAWLRPHVPPGMLGPVVVYIALISIMVASAFGTSASVTDPRIPAAAVAFALSDVLVARNQFVSPSAVNRLIGLPLYFAAQLLFVASV